VLRLPELMLARSGSIPRGGGWLFEAKLDGFGRWYGRFVRYLAIPWQPCSSRQADEAATDC